MRDQYERGAEIINQEEYFTHLIDTYQNLIYSICLQSCGNAFDAEDLMQEVYISAYKKLSDFDRTYEKAWLCKIAANKCLDFLKQAGRRVLPTEETFFKGLPDNHSSPEVIYLESEAKQQVVTLCRKLKSPYCEVAYDYFCKELSVKEIADKRKKNVKTIQTQIYRAKGMLKKWIERGD